MNNFSILSDSYKKLMEQGKIPKEMAYKEIRILDFLGTCDKSDLCRLIDSGAFNDIIKAYCRKALKDAKVDEDTENNVMEELRWLFDSVPAGEIE